MTPNGSTTSKRGAVAASAVALLSLISLPVVAESSSGCAGDDCDNDTQTWGSCTQGELAGGDPCVWESGPVVGKPWLNFHGERTWVFDPSPWMGSRQPIDYEAYLSFDPLPNPDGGGFANPAGNLAEYTLFQVGDAWKVSVTNDTCAQYYLRVVLTYCASSDVATPGACVADGGM
jgi:hypothetical protein